MNSKANSIEEKVKLPPTETISRCYQPQQSNRKVIRILTVAVYVLCVSLAAIMLSLYYIFIWDPSIRPFVTKANNCDKLVIPEKIAIRLMNSSELTAEQFYKHILEQYRILNQMQQQRQQFLQKQHLQLQQLANGNKFQEIFATATIIQSNPNDPLKKAVTPTNGTFLLEPVRPNQQLDPAHIPILGTSTSHIKRKFHRKHYGHHRRQNSSKYKPQVPAEVEPEQEQPGEVFAEIPLNPPTPVIQESFTSMPIPLILNSKEDKRPYGHHAHTHAARRTTARKRTTPMTVSGYDTESTYRNPLLAGEFIFEK